MVCTCAIRVCTDVSSRSVLLVSGISMCGRVTRVGRIWLCQHTGFCSPSLD